MIGTTDVVGMPVYCGHCGLYHAPPCPRIKAIEYHPDGTLKRVEYWGAADGSQQHSTKAGGRP